MATYKENIQKLDSPWRRIALPPKETLISLGLTPDMDFADIGCGIGYFTVPAAFIIDPSHPVYAIDPSTEMLNEARRRAEEAGLEHINFVHSEPYDFKIPKAAVDFALLANVFHEISEKDPFIGQIRDALKTGGKLALIEWNNQIMDVGPPAGHRISEDETDRLMQEGGFEIKQKLSLGEMFYGRVYLKK